MVIFNFSFYVLSVIEKNLLAKCLNFCLPPKQLKYVDYLIHFELFYRAYRNSWTLDARVGRWALYTGLWTLNAGRWTLDSGSWTLDAGLWILHLGS